MEKKQTSRSGVGFFGVLTAVLVGLKLAEVIDWSWWWVLSPTLIGWGITLVFITIILIIDAIIKVNGGK